MSISLIIVISIVVVLCFFIVKKIMSTDKNDIKIKDILSFKDEEPDEKIDKKDTSPEKIDDTNYSADYGTDSSTDYSTDYHDIKQDDDGGKSADDDDFLKEFKQELNKKYLSKPPRNLYNYVKTFWHGITFAIGMLVCIYSLVGILYFTQTTNDAIIYSIWLLIGVVLIK